MTAWMARRWRGEVPLQTLLWRDMLAVATLANLLCTAVGLGVLAAGAPIGWAVGLHFAALPWNLFLLACVWRSPQRSAFAQGIAVAWVVAMLVI